MSDSSDDGARPKSGVSRRGFLKGVGLGSVAIPAAGLLGGSVVLAEEAPPKPSGPKVFTGEIPIKLRINGKDHDLKVEPRTTLLNALRDRLDLTGSKLVCDRGTCGACSVIMDGLLVTSCMVLAIDAQGKEITTIEGLASGDKLDPIQAAFIEFDALQCGFCTPGLIMATKSLLKTNPHPTREEMQDALSGNICRCGTYDHIFAAIEKVAGGARG
ncbi:MAG: (2Fe-2S)-binding protein [Candidatus Sumerlaeaceae bacterium]|nr:(2Fe-2S)-binding protein [Candidatus Sumerlaeaceae bacterium]